MPQSNSVAQQRPLMQRPLAHSAFALHEVVGVEQVRSFPVQPAGHAGPWSAPAGAGSHWPWVSHASHSPSHADSQHTPSAQHPLLHSAAPAQPEPSAPRHSPVATLPVRPVAQSASELQLVGHAVLVPLQTKAPHVVPAGAA